MTYQLSVTKTVRNLQLQQVANPYIHLWKKQTAATQLKLYAHS